MLSDFGIAGLRHETTEMTGISVPWAAPEILRGDTSGTVATEVWSLAATVFSLVAGRSPAEQPGRANDHEALRHRIVAHDLQPSRAVTGPLRAVLDKALSARPADRHASVEELLLDLQRVQRELGHDETPIEVEADPWAARAQAEVTEEDADALRLRQPRARRSAGVTGSRIDISESTGRRERPPSRRIATRFGIAAAVVALLAVVAGAALALSTLTARIPVVAAVAATPEQGAVSFAWEDPGLVGSDSFHVVTSTGDALIQGGTTFRLTGPPGEPLCVTVAVNRDGSTGEAAEACAEPLP